MSPVYHVRGLACSQCAVQRSFNGSIVWGPMVFSSATWGLTYFKGTVHWSLSGSWGPYGVLGLQSHMRGCTSRQALKPRCSLRMWRNNKNQRTIRNYKSFLTLHTVNFAPLTGILPSHTATYVKHEKAGQSLPHIQSCDFIGESYCWYSDHVTSTAHVTPMKSFDWLACRPLVLQLVSFDIAITWLG